MKKPKKKNNHLEYISQLRQNPVSKDWITIAAIRAKRPEQLIINKPKRLISPKSNCPFENPQKSGHKPPELIKFLPNKKDWFLQIFENKYPAFQPKDVSVTEEKIGPYRVMNGYGYHELLVLRDHFKPLADYSAKELLIILKALQERYSEIAQDRKIKYISIFHNWGPTAGASIYHPHLQIIAIPVVPPHIQHSLAGSHRYWLKNKKCAHCEINKFEIKNKTRILIQNKKAISYSPFVSLEPFALRITPLKHLPYFEETPNSILFDIAKVLKYSLSCLKKKLNDPDYNLFIHTAPTIEKRKYHCYHWHIEIIPKINISAGFELSTGIEITTVDPDEGIKYLKS
jgi:UDPglucose--hexose-1-phosphate uridylyltransferase